MSDKEWGRRWAVPRAVHDGEPREPCSASLQDLDKADVRVTLDSALGLALNAAVGAFPDLSGFLLYPVTQRVLKGDGRGLHWQVRWQERTFPHRHWLAVRDYMSDGHTTTERVPAALRRPKFGAGTK